jgi:hypothetical protein
LKIEAKNGAVGGVELYQLIIGDWYLGNDVESILS